MRRRSPLVLLLFVLLLPVPSSNAQEAPGVRLTLLSQTPWNGPEDRELELRFRASHLGITPFADLAIGITLYARVLGQTAYQSSLIEDPSLVIDAETLAREGTLVAGQTRDFEISFALDSLGIDPEQSGVYPLKVDLRSGDSSIAELRTPAIFLVREPEVPMRLSWTFVLHHPITFGPDGAFLDTTLETSLEPGGHLHGQLRALRELAADPRQIPVDLAVSPTLLTQLARMRDGYQVLDPDGPVRVDEGEGGAALAAQALMDLRTIASAPAVSVSALPFSAPDLPSLYGGGLGRDVADQLQRGRSVTAAFTGTVPQVAILRPPGAALDEPTLRELEGSEVRTLLVGPGTLELPPQPLGFAGPPVAFVADTTLAAVVPEPATEALVLSLVDDDPVRAAQVLLGQLATIWQERPGEERGLALVLSEDVRFPGPFFEPFVRGVRGAPWLAPTSTSSLVLAFPPTEGAPLLAPSFRRFPTSYVAAIKQARRLIHTLSSMLPPDSDEPARLEAMLLLAEARQFLSAPDEGAAFIGAVRGSVRDTVDDLMLDTVEEVTLASESAGIPVTVSNTGDLPLRLTVLLHSQYLREEPSVELRLDPGERETFRLQAELRSIGRFPVTVQMLSPSGRVIGRPETVVVRSTTYNRIALFITIGAAIALVAVWARRFLPRRTP